MARDRKPDQPHFRPDSIQDLIDAEPTLRPSPTMNTDGATISMDEDDA